MKKPTFELKVARGNSEYRLIIATNQNFNEEELDHDISPIFNLVKPSLNNVTGNFLSGFSFNQCFETGPKWILAEPDSEGIRHRIGISVHPQLLDKLITEMNLIGYRIVHQGLEYPIQSRELNSRYV